MTPRRLRGGWVALVGGLLTLAPMVATAAPAPSTGSAAAASGACTDSTGITVVVDARAFGKGVQVRCAPQPVRSGFDALTRAGFTFDGTVRFPGLLCRIDGQPASDPCHGAPPPDAYWGYWHASRGGGWTYSTSGAGTRVPPPGSVEGWAFGDDARPGTDPPAPPVTPTTTRSTPAPPPTAGSVADPSSPAAGGPAPTVAGAPGTPSTTAPGATSGPPTTGADDPTVSPPDRDQRASDEVAGAPSAGGGDGSSAGGSPLGVIVALVVVGAVGGAAVSLARRRRAVEDGIA